MRRRRKQVATKICLCFLVCTVLYVQRQQGRDRLYDTDTEDFNNEAITTIIPERTWLREVSDAFDSEEQTDITFIKQNNTDKTCGDFHETLEDNLAVVEKYPFTVPEKYLQYLQLDDKGIQRLSNEGVTNNDRNNSPFPVIVSAASSNHFLEIQGLIKTIHERLLPIYPDLRFIFYDIGLNTKQLALMKKYCKCEVRQFLSNGLPKHIKQISGYGWKPIIIQMVLKEFDFVMWTDSSVRFTGNRLDKLVDDTERIGIQIIPGWGSMAVRTNNRTFSALGEDPCLFDFPESEATWMVFRRTRFTLTAIMKPWVSCALQYGCMDFPGSRRFLFCPIRKKQKLGTCHRFDQSVIGIILARLFNHKIHLCHFTVNGIGDIKRAQSVRYFPSS